MKSPTVFTASQFTPTQWESAEQKAKFANQFVRLIERGFQQSDFPHWFYSRLANTFGHIAHYDTHGFWAEWFSSTRRQVEFLEHTAQGGGYGDAAWTYCDVERAIKTWLEENPQFKAALVERRDNAVEIAERAELARLTAKYKNIPEFRLAA